MRFDCTQSDNQNVFEPLTNTYTHTTTPVNHTEQWMWEKRKDETHSKSEAKDTVRFAIRFTGTARNLAYSKMMRTIYATETLTHTQTTEKKCDLLRTNNESARVSMFHASMLLWFNTYRVRVYWVANETFWLLSDSIVRMMLFKESFSFECLLLSLDDWKRVKVAILYLKYKLSSDMGFINKAKMPANDEIAMPNPFCLFAFKLSTVQKHCENVKVHHIILLSYSHLESATALTWKSKKNE